MFDDWVELYGEGDTLSRRQGRLANVRCPQELAAIVKIARQAGVPIALTLNARYSSSQERRALELAEYWAGCGGNAILVADPAFLCQLRKRLPELAAHASLLAGIHNSHAANFYAGLGADRLVLPRHLTIGEVGMITRNAPALNYEMLVLYQKCEFMDGFCGFYHAVRLPRDVPACFDYEPAELGEEAILRTADPNYPGHGCERSYQSAAGPVRHLSRDDLAAPHCAACQLATLQQAGVNYLKLAGRGYPVEMIVAGVKFLKAALAQMVPGNPQQPAIAKIRELYKRTFGKPCMAKKCYYQP